MATSLLSRFVQALRNGVSFGGNRDLYKVFGWDREPTYRNFLDMYRRNGIAKRVVNAPADALWSDPPVITADKAFQTAWDELLRNQKVFYNLNRLDKLAGLGKYAVLLVGFNDGARLELPVTNKSGLKVLYLQPYAEVSAKVDRYDLNPSSARFGLPETYILYPGSDSDKLPGVTTLLSTANGLPSFKVHWTRVLHIAENALETPILGRPRVESAYNALCDLQKVTGSSAETYWLAGNRGLHVDVDKEMDLDPEDEDALEEELKEYQHEQRRTIRTRGVDIKEIGSSSGVADPRPAFQTMLNEIAADTGMPQRMIVGTEAGSLASQQDRASWALRVSERISNFGEPVVLLPFVRLLIDSGVLPEPKQFQVDWPDAFKMNPLERAQTSAQMARSAANLSKTLETVEKVNQSMARAALPQLVTTPMSSSMSSDSVPTQTDGISVQASKPTTTEGPASDDPNAEPAAPAQAVTEPLMPKRPPLVLLTEEECRSIIGFGKHPPIFDDANNTPAAVNDPQS